MLILHVLEIYLQVLFHVGQVESLNLYKRLYTLLLSRLPRLLSSYYTGIKEWENTKEKKKKKTLESFFQIVFCVLEILYVGMILF